MAKVLIANYRGYDINFEPETERFQWEIDNGRWMEKQSYGAVKKEIDDFIKDKSTFEPFEIIQLGNSFTDERLATVISIRKDGRFTIESKGKKEMLSGHDEKYWILYNKGMEVTLATIAVCKAEISEIQNKITKHLATISKTTLDIVKQKYIK